MNRAEGWVPYPEAASQFRESQREAMQVQCAFWRDLQSEFRALINPIRLVATVIDDRWTFTFDGPTDRRGRNRLRVLFDDLAVRAARAAGASKQENARDAWLNLLRKEGPHFQPIEGTGQDGDCHKWSPDSPPILDLTHVNPSVSERRWVGGWIQDLVKASAEYCQIWETRAFESLGAASVKTYTTSFERNVDRLRQDFGWSFDDLASKTGLDKKLILGHVNHGRPVRPKTVSTYAQAFTKKLNRTVTVALVSQAGIKGSELVGATSSGKRKRPDRCNQ